MIISDLAYVENISESTSVQGGLGLPPSMPNRPPIQIKFSTLNSFTLEVNPTYTLFNNASAGAAATATNKFPWVFADSFVKADTAVDTTLFGGGSATSTSVAVINEKLV